MKTLNFWILAFAIFSMASFTSCNNNSQADKAVEDVEDASEEFADLFRTEKEELQADIKDMQREISQKAEDLKMQLNTASGEAAEEINQKINQLDAWNKELGQELDRLGNAAESNWQEVKAGIQKSMNDIKQQWNETFES